MGIFLSSAHLICQITDISKCFRGSLQLRDNESRLYNLQYIIKGLAFETEINCLLMTNIGMSFGLDKKMKNDFKIYLNTFPMNVININFVDLKNRTPTGSEK